MSLQSKIFSFDIFDTCFVRACGSPKNVFDILARRILGEIAEESFLCDFALIRIKAEEKAREESQYEDITLTEIYEYCDFTGLTDMSNAEIMNTEILVEREQLVPVWDLKEKIQGIHNQGKSVMYVSDMYLSRDFLLQLLRGNNFWKEGDKLYVSSEIRKTKQSGALYRYIADENQIKFKDWHHYGDNRYSDYKIPRRLGIKAQLVKHDFSFYEKSLAKLLYINSFQTGEVLASISKASRISFQNNTDGTFISDLVAPLFTIFVYSVLKNASNNGIRVLCFLARDGYLLYHIAKQLQPLFPDIDLKYIYISRSSLYLPALEILNKENLESIIKYDFKDADIKKSLKNLIDINTYNKLIQKKDINTIYDIFSTPELTKILNEYRQQQREFIIKYFEQEGLAREDNNAAIVDLRGSRLSHKSINMILSSFGYSKVRGYYLEVFEQPCSLREYGPYWAMIYSDRQSDFISNYIEICNILEEYFAVSPEKRTISYDISDDKICPIYGEDTVEPVKIELAKLSTSVIAEYVKLFFLSLPKPELSLATILIRNLIFDFANKPIKEYLFPLNRITQRRKPIVNKLNYLNLKKRNYSWLRGSFIYTFGFYPSRLMKLAMIIMQKIKDLL